MRTRFTQTIRFKCADPNALVELLRQYDSNQASMDVMGFIGTRLLCDRNNSGHYVIVAEFAEVDGELTAAEEAMLNNERGETTGWYENLMKVISGEPEFNDYDEIYWTGITGNLRTG